MRIAMGADHAGFELKQAVKQQLLDAGHEVEDVGTESAESVDYPPFAAAAARLVASGEAERGVIVRQRRRHRRQQGRWHPGCQRP